MAQNYPPPGTALVEELDQRLLIQLRDRRIILGILRSFDQVRWARGRTRAQSLDVTGAEDTKTITPPLPP